MDRKQEFRKRTRDYAGAVVRLYCSMPTSREEIRVMGRQLLRSGTAVAATYREASRARSRAEFVSKIDMCTQEADETSLWLDLLETECAVSSELLTWVKKETEELIAIFVTMSKRTKENDRR
jgi:four helix bundle protein